MLGLHILCFHRVMNADIPPTWCTPSWAPWFLQLPGARTDSCDCLPVCLLNVFFIWRDAFCILFEMILLLYAHSIMCACMLSHFSLIWFFATPWTVALQVPPSMGFSRQEYWSGLPCPPPGDLPDPGIEPTSLISPALTGGFFTTRATWQPHNIIKWFFSIREFLNGLHFQGTELFTVLGQFPWAGLLRI